MFYEMKMRVVQKMELGKVVREEQLLLMESWWEKKEVA